MFAALPVGDQALLQPVPPVQPPDSKSSVIELLGGGTAVTFKAMPNVFEPAVTVNGWGPALTPEPTVTVSVLLAVPFAGGVTLAGLYPQLTPLARPLQPSVTELLYPPVEVTVHVLVPFDPACMLRLPGLHDTL
jgi:hypothetical protein